MIEIDSLSERLEFVWNIYIYFFFKKHRYNFNNEIEKYCIESDARSGMVLDFFPIDFIDMLIKSVYIHYMIAAIIREQANSIGIKSLPLLFFDKKIIALIFLIWINYFWSPDIYVKYSIIIHRENGLFSQKLTREILIHYLITYLIR